MIISPYFDPVSLLLIIRFIFPVVKIKRLNQLTGRGGFAMVKSFFVPDFLNLLFS